METIRVHTDFHAAHRQLDYPGKCRHVHGHTWKGSIAISTDRFPLDELEMSIDFGGVKDVLRRFDHKIIVCETDDLFADGRLFDPDGVIVIPGTNPSVENIAHHCLNEVISLIKSKYPDRNIVYAIEITVQETDNNIFTLESDVVI